MPNIVVPKEDVYCTLLLNDAYLPGALVVARSLRDYGTRRKLAVLVTSTHVSQDTILRLKHNFDHVIDVKKLTNHDLTALNTMGRTDLLATFTKIALWQQTQFRKIVYLDADTLPLRAPNELFDLAMPFAAGPEIGFPDCFNSGVMVLEPNPEIYKQLLDLANRGTSFDGGDQGLLNIHFHDFYRLSFMYNVELYRSYRLYMPALEHYKDKLSVVHFIGREKPWDMRGKTPVDQSAYAAFYCELIERWWAVYNNLTADES